MEEKGNKFEYTYSAPTETERREIESIRRQYEPQGERKETKLERLRRLNSRVNNTASCISLISGVIGTLIFGLGLSMMLEWSLYLWGVIVGFVGVIPIALAYPLYKKVLYVNKKKYGKEILALSEELLKEKE